MAMGTVKWFNAAKGYGFIKPDGGGPGVFVHISVVEKAGYSSLVEGAKISHEVVAGRAGKMSAEKLRLAWSPYFYRCAKPSFARRSRFLRLTGNQNNRRSGL